MQSKTSTSSLPRRVSGLILLCLMLCLQACATKPQAPGAVVTKTQRDQPPVEWTNLTPVPQWPDTMLNGELLDFARLNRARLQSCNDDKTAIVKWSAALPPITDQTAVPAAPKRSWWPW